MASPRLLVVDNYDSFTHNIAHALQLAGASCEVVDNDAYGAATLLSQGHDGIVLSAGPCTPTEAGVCLALVERLSTADHTQIPLLGICLGHQTIAQALGARLRPATRPIHGKRVRLRHDGRGSLAALPEHASVVRYNSLVVDEGSLPEALEPCGWDEDGDLMALRHRTLPFEGVQFHPESWLGPDGAALLTAWVANVKGQT